MITISQATFSAPYQPIPQNSEPKETQPPAEDPSKTITIEITPGEENVSSGDKSQNTAQISITTPNNALEFEVSREGFYNAAERRTTKKAIDAYTAGRRGGNEGIGPVKTLALREAGVIDAQDIEELVTIKLKKDQLAAYSKSYQQASSLYDNSSQDYSYQSNNDNLNAFNQAQNAYIKQEIFFSTIDRIGSKKNALDSYI